VFTFCNKIPCQIAENSFFSFMSLAMPGKYLLWFLDKFKLINKRLGDYREMRRQKIPIASKVQTKNNFCFI
jgi:hypothetical protein